MSQCHTSIVMKGQHLPLSQHTDSGYFETSVWSVNVKWCASGMASCSEAPIREVKVGTCCSLTCHKWHPKRIFWGFPCGLQDAQCPHSLHRMNWLVLWKTVTSKGMQCSGVSLDAISSVLIAPSSHISKLKYKKKIITFPFPVFHTVPPSHWFYCSSLLSLMREFWFNGVLDKL